MIHAYRTALQHSCSTRTAIRLAPLVIAAGLALLGLCRNADADINPWVAANVYNPEKWDTSGPETGTPWLHPATWTPSQDWGMLSGSEAFKDGRWQKFTSFSGSWGGVRDELVRRGVAFSSAYYGQPAASLYGGERRGATLKGNIGVALFLDFDRLFRWKGGYFTASFDYKHPGQTLSEDFIGNQFPVQLNSFDDTGATRLVHLAFGQQLFDNTAELVAGRLIAGEDFASIRLACTSINQAICGNPILAPRSISFPTYPNATWGTRFKIKPGSGWYAQAGTYLVFSEFSDADLHGVKFSAPDGSGLLTLGEFGYIVGHYRNAPGLPGKYKVGGYVDTEQLEDLSTGSEVHGTWGIYGIAEQMLYSENKNYDQGLSAFLALSYAPPNRNSVTFMAAGGLSYQGLIPGRPDDGLAFITALGKFSNRRQPDDPAKDYELLLELNYRVSIASWLYATPDLQWIIHPGGRGDINDAFAVSLGFGVVF